MSMLAELRARDKAVMEELDSLDEQIDIRPVPAGFALRRAGDLKPRAPEWIVRDLLEADSLALIFGDPGCGKSFLAIDWACSVATGQACHGHSVKQAPVIYIAGEGQNGLARRFQAWSIRHDQDLAVAPLFVSGGPAALCDDLAVTEVVRAVDNIAHAEGVPGLVVVDTVARNFGPGDENSTRDMTGFIAAADAIRTRYRCTVLLVHHTGHADKTRARGAMALKGALDAEYRLDKDDDGVIRLESKKMKDAEPPEPKAFKLRTVELPIIDDEGNPVTSAILDSVEYQAPAKSNNAPRGKWQALALESLQKLHEQYRRNLEADGRDPDNARVSLDDWRLACADAGMPRQRWSEVWSALGQQGTVKIEHGFVWIN